MTSTRPRELTLRAVALGAALGIVFGLVTVYVALEVGLNFSASIPIGGTAHQAGTLVFGRDPATSVLDVDCKAHDLDNLYVTDASFFPSIGAVNPTLTIIANALRVADIVISRLG